MGLRPYQIDCIDAIVGGYTRGQRRQLVVLPTGGGKTEIFSRIPGVLASGGARRRYFVLNHRDELCAQTAEKMARANPTMTVGIEKAESRANNADIVVLSVQTVGTDAGAPRLQQFNPDQVAAVIPDECFPAGTLVDGRAIETIRPGEYVAAYCHSSESMVQRKVVRTSKTVAVSLVRLVLSDGREIVCTPTHPVYNLESRTYIPAEASNELHCMSMPPYTGSDDQGICLSGMSKEVREESLAQRRISAAMLSGVQTAAQGSPAQDSDIAVLELPNPSRMLRGQWPSDGSSRKSMLLERMQGDHHFCTVSGNAQAHRSWPDIRQDEDPQPDVQSHHKREDENLIASNGVGSACSWRKWLRTHCARILAGFGVGVGHQYHRANQGRSAEWIPIPLQSGRGQSCSHDRDRDRRPEPLFPQGPGCQENRTLGAIRVVRVEVLKQGSDGTFGGMCPDGHVYNLEVEEHHNYFANGILVHNCHLGVATIWKKILEHFRMMKGKSNDSPALLCGFTATTDRLDGIGLESLFDSISYQAMDIKAMVEAGYLAPAVASRFTTTVDISGVSKGKDGDLAINALGRKINISSRNEQILREFKPFSHLPAIGFAANVEHAQDMTDLFNANGITSACVHAKTPAKQRKEIFDGFRRFAIKTLWQVDVATTGTDLPMATVGIFARPTLSRLWYTQAAGRLFRPYPAPEAFTSHTGYRKAHAVLLDFVDNTAKHKLITAPTLYGLPAKFEAKGVKLHEAKQQVDQVRMKFKGSLPISNFGSLQELAMAQTRVALYDPPEIPADVKRLSKFAWFPVTESLCAIYLQSHGAVFEVATNLLGQREVYVVRNGTRMLQGTYSDPKEAFAYVEGMADKNDRLFLDRGKGWRKEPPSNPQLWKLYWANPNLQKQFSAGTEFIRHAQTEFARGNRVWSKGSVSNMINSLVVSR